jgi:hypothetical protein
LSDSGNSSHLEACFFCLLGRYTFSRFWGTYYSCVYLYYYILFYYYTYY